MHNNILTVCKVKKCKTRFFRGSTTWLRSRQLDVSGSVVNCESLMWGMMQNSGCLYVDCLRTFYRYHPQKSGLEKSLIRAVYPAHLVFPERFYLLWCGFE